MTSTKNLTETPISTSSSSSSSSPSSIHHKKLLSSTTEMLSLLSCNTTCSCSSTSTSCWSSTPTTSATIKSESVTTTSTATTINSPSSSSLLSPSYSLPDGTKILENQVAGHTFQEGTNSIGLLKDEKTKTVLKPAGKPICAAREIGFYKLLETTDNPDLINIKRLVPEFKGTEKIKINDKEMDFIRLEDLTYGMVQPCIMDIKIGKRTWDPEATPDKIKAEEEKYSACKKTIGLCIPGFQLYSLKNNSKLIRFSKDYGKKLNPKTFIDTLKLFLNYDYNGDCINDMSSNDNIDIGSCSDDGGDGRFCKKLITEILLKLLDIEKWSKTQKTINLYSSSILIVYDAKRLKYCINNSVAKRHDIHTNNGYLNNHHYHHCNCFNLKQEKILNGSINSNSLLLNKITNDPSEVNSFSSQNHHNHHTTNKFSNSCNNLSENSIKSENSEKLNGITSSNHCNNYCCDIHHDFDIKNSSSSSSSSTSSFVRVKMIDFAHVFPSTDNTIDTNYLFGIENLVKIVKGFLNEITIREQQYQNQEQEPEARSGAHKQ